MGPLFRHIGTLTTGAALAITLSLSAPLHAEEGTPAHLPLDDLRTFTEIFERIRSAYVEEVTDQELLESAIKGMLAGLDPHSAYLDPEAFNDLQVNTSGEFGGLGIEVGMENGFIKVVAPIDDTPAAEAGIEAGDLIIKLDKKPVKGMSLQEAVELMRGKPGTAIELTIMRSGSDAPFDLTLKRAVIRVTSVKSRELEPGYGYLRITQFQVNSGEEVTRSIEKLRQQHPLNGLVIDLRNNPGGVLQAAVDVSDLFLEKGLIVYTEGRIPNSELRFNASDRSIAPDTPLVVLINGGSASASEIVAGALQDHHRAIIMGTDSFGKGSVQTVLPLANQRALKLTTALYYTPNGRSIQAQGIVPDIEVERATLTPAERSTGVKEADLQGHLGNGNGGADKPSSELKEARSHLAQEDYQLYQALSLLKGLHISRYPQQAPATSTTEAPDSQ
ncbi:S41 family peptidase [Aestuariirhabdus litorea]|uniref:S41 family peptidase n=1 Tax=Aestuariirhabdus litorea TaxID=2528527 RepID=A0A3P3VQK3_9GAMM|nr:S41 family peptidase [Aestuariirhabdus litorea]RRJ83103.1 S41 family peptidase [Aestuariirhabdus litorea]RWW93260.1 PDZ domain-containing protein [Endozoicomonadaceae bacterium GTF-13]